MNAIFGNEPRRSEATLLSPFQGDRFQWPAYQGLRASLRDALTPG